MLDFARIERWCGCQACEHAVTPAMPHDTVMCEGTSGTMGVRVATLGCARSRMYPIRSSARSPRRSAPA